MDQEHIKFVLSTGFKNFWRGISQKERMYVATPLAFWKKILTGAAEFRETLLGAGIFNRDDDVTYSELYRKRTWLIALFFSP